MSLLSGKSRRPAETLGRVGQGHVLHRRVPKAAFPFFRFSSSKFRFFDVSLIHKRFILCELLYIGTGSRVTARTPSGCGTAMLPGAESSLSILPFAYPQNKTLPRSFFRLVCHNASSQWRTDFSRHASLPARCCTNQIAGAAEIKLPA